VRFVDEARIRVISGSGGKGCVSFRREKYVPRGGPDGGDGGKGGDVIIRSDPSLSSLIEFHYRQIFRARKGKPGKGKKQAGKDGEDLTIPVPVGTIVRDAETGETLRDLAAAGESYIAARGGRGGRGNAVFATATDRAPRRADPGGAGKELYLHLELKLLADVGLVGLPNAGKSTLISRMTGATPKIADYPFTTLTPHIGVAETEKFGIRYVVADVPGLISGAHTGAGLGIRFLRHLERTRILLVILDLSGDDPAGDYATLIGEIDAYGATLPGKTRLVALNKIDLPEGREKRERVAEQIQSTGVRPFPISALTGEGIEEVKKAIAGTIQIPGSDHEAEGHGTD